MAALFTYPSDPLARQRSTNVWPQPHSYVKLYGRSPLVFRLDNNCSNCCSSKHCATSMQAAMLGGIASRLSKFRVASHTGGAKRTEHKSRLETHGRWFSVRNAPPPQMYYCRVVVRHAFLLASLPSSSVLFRTCADYVILLPCLCT